MEVIMRKKVAMIGVGKLGEPCAEAMSEYHDVVGYDVLPRTPQFPMKETIKEAVSERDLIFISDVGAYGSSLSSNYNIRPKPSEILINKSKITILKKRQKLEDII